MRKLKLFFACLLMAVLSIGQVWATDVTYTFTSKSWADASSAWTGGGDGNGFTNGQGIQVTTGTTGANATSNSSFSNVSKVVVTYNTNKSKGAGSIAIKIGTNDEVSNSVAYSGSADGTSANFTTQFDFSPVQTGAIKITTNTTTNSIWVKSITITYSDGGTPDPTVSADPEEVEDVPVAGVTNQTIDLTYENITDYETEVSVHPNADGTGTLSPAWLTASVSDADDYATVTYSVSANEGAARTAYIKVYTTDGDKEATTIIPVSQVKYSAPTGTFELFSGDLVEGEYVICSGTTALKNTSVSGPRIGYETVSVSASKIQNPDESLIWKIEALTGDDAGKWAIHNEAEDVYAAFNTTDGRGVLLDAVTDYAKWTTSGTYDFINVGKTSKNYLRYNNGYGFASYASGTGATLTLYKKADGKPAAPTFSPAGGSYLEAQNVTISAAAGVDEIRYTLDESTPTASSTLYSGAIPVSSTTTIKAIAIKDAVEGHVATATYTITTPLSVTAALELIPNPNDQVNDQYVEGFVCTAAPEVLTGGKMTYYISADGSETDRLQIYKGKNLDNTEFSNVNDLAIGDKVIIFGQLKNYSGTKEMNDGNYIVRRTAKGALSSVVVSGTPDKTAYSADEAFEPAGLVVTATYASGYAVNVASELAAADWSATPATVTENGNISVTATYGGLTSAAYLVPVTVVAATLDHIALSYDAVEVYQGKPLPKPVVTAHWSDASTSDVTALASFTGYDKDTPGDQTITVSYQFGTGDPEEATYTVTVKPIYNVELAASVAKDLIETVVGNTESTSDMIVRGIVSQVGSIDGTTKGLTYYISDDGTTTNQLEIYKGKYLEKADFTNANKLKVGDEVVVTGKVIYYNGTTAEFANGKSEVTSLARVPNFTIAAVASFEVGAADLAVADLTITQDGEGAVTLASSDHPEYVSIADGKLHAVAVGDATITANLAANGIYKAASVTFDVHVIAATVKYAITFSGNGATGGDAPEFASEAAAGANITLPANTYTYTGHSFTGWKVYDENEDEVTVTAGAFTMPASPVTIKAQWAEISVWATTYTSNVTLTTVTNAQDVKVVISETEYDAVKAGTGKAGGSIKVTVPAQATTLHLHAAGWSGENPTISIDAPDGVTVSMASISATADAGINTNSPFTLENDPIGQYIALSLSGNTDEIELTFSVDGGNKRFVIYGVNQEGGVVPVLDHITITGTMTNTTGWKTGDNIVPEGLTVNAIYTLNNVEQTPVEVDPNDVVWSHAALTEGQTEVTLNASYTDGVEKTANTNVTIEAVVTGEPSITTDVNSRSWTVNKGAAIPAAKTFAVTLKNIASATVTPGGDNPDAFNITPATLTASGNITVSVVSTATVGTYTATITIKDDASATSKVVNVSLTVENEEVPVSTTSEWVAATDADLVDGAEVLITGVASEVTYAIGEDRGNNRAAVAGTLSEGVFTPGANTMSFILEDQGDGTFALRASNGNYLYAASSSANQLKTRAAIEDGDAKWTLTATSAIANGSNTNETIRFNSTNDPKIFSCYADETKQLAIAFYVPKPVTKYTVTFDKNDGSATTSVEVNAGEKVAKPADPIREGFTFNYWTLNSVEYDFDASVTDNITLVASWTENPTPAYETVRTLLEVGRYYTVCLPKKVTAIKGASFWTLNNKSQDGATAYLEEETNNLPFAAGKPFIIQATAENLEVVYEGDATEVAGINGALHGTLVYMNAAALAAAGSDVYMLFNNVLCPVGENNHLDANRAYVKLSALTPVSSAPQGAPGKRVVAMPMQKDEAQGFDNLESGDAPKKVMIDGTLYILRGEKVFDATGRLVK